MDGHGLDNPNPSIKILDRQPHRPGQHQTLEEQIFDVIRDIRDPEHPHSLEELSVVDKDSIHVAPPPGDYPSYGRVRVDFTPTVPHCSLASIIGLSIQRKLRDSALLNPRGEHYYKLRVCCVEGTHAQAEDINRQLADKERVSAAFENPKITGLLQECISNLP